MKPFQPSHSRPAPAGHHQQVVGRIDLSISLQSRSDHPREDEPRYARREVDHVATRVVQCAVSREVAAAPDQERVDRVHECDPQHHVGDPRLQVDPPEHRAKHQDRGDRGEHELEVHERGLREVERWPFGDRRDARLGLLGPRAPSTLPGLPDECVEEAFPRPDRMAEAHLEGPQAPHDQRHAERHEGEHHAVDRPALLHHAAVQDREARQAHQPDERGRGHLPRVVTCVQPTWV